MAKLTEHQEARKKDLEIEAARLQGILIYLGSELDRFQEDLNLVNREQEFLKRQAGEII